MESFKNFLESEDAAMQYTRNDPHNRSALIGVKKQSNLDAAQRLIDQNPQMLLHQVVQFDRQNPGEVTDILDFARRHDFDDSMPLHSLVLVYNRFGR